MKPHAQILLIALAITFTVALALTVALVCSSRIKDTPIPESPEPELPADKPTGGDADEPPVEDEADGLKFLSNGNGTCALAGIGTYGDDCLFIPEYAPTGERVTEITAMAFYGCDRISTVQIPASVVRIGDLAFADCGELVYISVSPENPAYRDVDGVLYTADEKTLILYPPRRVGSSLPIGSVTVKIADMAFYNCQNLTRIVYGGSAEQWESIRIGIKNYSLTAAAKVFQNSD